MSILKVRGNLPKEKAELIILDRDGTLNVDAGYSFRLSELSLIPGVLETLSDARFESSVFAIASNQAGISKGKFSIEQSILFTEELCQLLASSGIHISAFAFCPHGDFMEKSNELCEYRKPNPGMLIMLMNLFGIPKESTFFVGDSDVDESAALNADIKFIRALGVFPRIGDFS
jgi:histidinol-phosphate phosphatase family protein